MAMAMPSTKHVRSQEIRNAIYRFSGSCRAVSQDARRSQSAVAFCRIKDSCEALSTRGLFDNCERLQRLANSGRNGTERVSTTADDMLAWRSDRPPDGPRQPSSPPCAAAAGMDVFRLHIHSVFRGAASPAASLFFARSIVRDAGPRNSSGHSPCCVGEGRTSPHPQEIKRGVIS